MNWDDFDAFCHVVDEGGFSAAARVLHWPKSRVSAAVSRLESDLDSRLLERTTRRVRLTTQGEELYRKAAPVFERLRRLRADSLASATTMAGKLRIAAPYEFAAHHLGPVTCELLARHPDLEIDIDMHYEQVDLVEGRYDIVFTAVDGVLPDSGLVVRLTRGRAWIAVLGVLLVGIVALNVVTLSFAASSGKTDEAITALDQENSILRGRDARLSGIGAVRNAAVPLGLTMPNTEEIHVTEAGPRDVATAAARLAAAGP